MITYLGDDPRHCWAHLNFLPENATEDWKILSLGCWGKKSLIFLLSSPSPKSQSPKSQSQDQKDFGWH